MGDDGCVNPEDEARLATLREMLTASGAGIYLAAHLAGPLAAETIAAMHESDDLELRLGRVGPERADDMAQRDEEARAVMAAVMRVGPDRLVLTHGAAEGAALAALGIVRAPGPGDAARPGPVVLVGGLDPAVAAALEGVAAAAGAEVVRLPDHGVPLPAGSRIVAAPHVDRFGDVLDVAALAGLAHGQGAPLILDASLACGAMDTDYAACGADVVLVAGQHWLLGPEGIAGTWLSPTLGDGAADALRSRVGGFSRSTLLGLARSVGWLLMYVGVPWVVSRTSALAARMREGLAAVDGVELKGRTALAPSGLRSATAPLLAFGIRGWSAREAANELSRRPFAILEADERHDALRVSAGAWLREEDVDAFVAAVAALARHRPETLPRRPALSIFQQGDAGT
jgi:selenocysteine lyase/cysteine desulfurase